MKKILLLALVASFSVACNPSKKVRKYEYLTEDIKPVPHTQDTPPPKPEPQPEPAPKPEPKVEPVVSSAKQKVIKKALSFQGTPYKYGGLSKSGMDCSGLIYTSYQSVGKKLPRISRDMASAGETVTRARVQEGDLVFFASTGGRSINHVGMVVEVKGNSVSFIHATTSRGVRTDLLNEGYWKDKYIKAVRVSL